LSRRPFVSSQRRRQRQVAPRGISAERQPLRIDLGAGAALAGPVDHGDDLVQSHREADLGRSGIVDADHHEPGAMGVFAHQPVVGVDAEQGPAAAVHVDQRRRGRGHAGRDIEPDAD